MTTTISVAGAQPYNVLIGQQLLGELPSLFQPGTARVLIIHPKALATTGTAIQDDLKAAGFDAYIAEVPDAEEAKTAQVAAFLWGVLGQAGFTRSDAIVGVGGGSTTDLAGFVAATWLRGVQVVQVPTTLAGMVDAAVGGKTGINTAEGKNLVGAFHPPMGVICDLNSLETLPRHDFVAGLAEVVKCGFIADTSILDILEKNPEPQWDSAEVAQLIARSVQVKADVVGQDLTESGLREILNYGHTFGHAIEQVERFTWRHGSAVSVGMIYVAELARLAGRLDEQVVTRHRDLLTRLGLPTSYRQDRWEQLLTAMRRDKKTRGDRLRFVILRDIGQPIRLEGPDPALLHAAYTELAGTVR